MNKFQAMMVSVMLAATSTTAQAGGILTNTNQSIDFLRNPARDAAIGLDGVYYNPAGVAFMPDGLHLGFNWQYAHQTRTITSTDDYFALGKKNNGQTTKVYEGVADAPFIPSIQAAWNKGDWSVQFNFSIPSGGGSCEFENGLGSFERKVGEIAAKFMGLDLMANTLNGVTGAGITDNLVTGYNMDSYMEGRQYYFGFQLGTAYKIDPKVSVYGGLRVLYGTATYKARISNIQVRTENGDLDFGSFLPHVSKQVTEMMPVASQVLGQLQQKETAGLPLNQQEMTLKSSIEGLAASQQSGELNSLAKYSSGVNLLCNQWSVGVAPIVGVDYKLNDHFNFAAKYEFKTQIRMKNESTVFEASEIEAVNKFKDEEKVNEDVPAMAAIGAQWTPVKEVRINAGGHYYFDKQAEWYGNAQHKLDHNSYEILAGAEWDVTDRLTISVGGQLTRYGLTDEYMNDMSFVVNSYSIGFGGNYKATDRLTLKAGFFQTEYGNYERTVPTKDDFTRTNRVLGIGCQVDL